MALFLREIRRGRACTLFALGDENNCPVWEFLAELKQNNRNEFMRVSALLDYTAEQGPPKNMEKCRYIKELRGFEFKTRGGVRIMGFWDSDQLIICSHGFMKKSQKTPKRELQRAKLAQESYVFAKTQNAVQIKRGDKDNDSQI